MADYPVIQRMLERHERELRIRKGLLYIQDRFEDLVLCPREKRPMIIRDIRRVLHELETELSGDKEIVRGDNLEGNSDF